MKKNYLLILLLATLNFTTFSQQSYYNDVDLTLNGIALKDELAAKIISTHTNYLSYSNVWSASKITDLDPNDVTNSNVILIYGYSDTDGNYVTDRTRSKNLNGGNNGTDWNREHTYAKSLGSPNLGTSGPGSDAHHLRPADVTFNGQRSSLKFITGSGNAGPVGSGWYPGDEWKGDIARMMMYMYLRYGNRCTPTGVGFGSSAATPDAMIDLFLQWNAQDPVSQIERNRNTYHENSANTYAQGNRNPFIDEPYLATRIWGGPSAEDTWGLYNGTADTQAPTTPSNVVATSTTQTSTTLTWNASSDNTAVTGYLIFKNENQIATTTGTNYSVTGLTASTNYTFFVKAIDAVGNVSSQSNTLSITTNSGGGGNGVTTDLFLSEYVEGSSYNKALEIANFTGSPINLTNYSLKKVSNGGGSWSTALQLSGNLNNSSVYVIAHSNASTTITSIANQTSTGTVMSFNGNDAIGLFKNGTLIDLIGNPNSSANFAKDKTLQRKPSITSPNTTYTISEWTVLAKNTFSGLGNHTINSGTPTDTTVPSAPTNLSTSNIAQTSVTLSWNASTDNIAVTGYDVYNGATKIATVNTTSFNVTGLTQNTIYSFSVKAFDATGNTSNSSNIINVTTLTSPDTTAPSAPTNLTASNIAQTSVTLSWNASTDNIAVTGYDVYNGATKIATVNATSFNVTGLTQNTAYSFSVKAFDAVSNISNTSNSINVTTLAAPDTTAPSNPSNLSASNIAQTSVFVTWNASTDNIAVTGYDIYKGGAKIATVNTTSFNVTGLSQNTAYSFSVKAFDAAGNISNSSNIINVTTLTNTVNYCTSKGTNINYEFIDFVGIGGISNTTGANNGYGDFTAQVGNLPYGNNTIVLSIGFASSSYTENWSVWIDYNQNGVFEITEQVVTGSTSSAGNLSYTFNVPTTALSGNTRMRVSMKWSGAATACQTFTYGEVEDYTVQIGSSSLRNGNPNSIKIDGKLYNEKVIFNAIIYPNPTKEILNIHFSDNRKGDYKILNSLGQIIKHGIINATKINISDLKSGQYTIIINDGQRSLKKQLIKH